MPSLPDGWHQQRGASCAGWDIWIGFSPHRPEGSRFAMFRRRIADQEHYDMGKTYATQTAANLAIAHVREMLQAGRYTFDDLFPDEVIIDHPTFGAF